MSYFTMDDSTSIDWRFSPWCIPIVLWIAAVFIAYPFWRVYDMLKTRTELQNIAIFAAIFIAPIAAIAYYFRHSIGQ